MVHPFHEAGADIGSGQIPIQVPHIRGLDARFRTAGREGNARAYLLAAGEAPDEEVAKGGAARPVVAAIERERLREIERQLPLSNRPTAQRAFCSCGPRAQPKQEQKAQRARKRVGG